MKRFNIILLAATALSLSGCGDTLRKLDQIGDQPPLTKVDNPQMRPDYKPLSWPLPDPEGNSTRTANSLWQPGARGFFRDQRATRVGDILKINVAIADSARRHIGISFAVPLATLQRLVPRLEAGGVLPRPSLGLRFREDRGLSAAIPALRQGGILVEHVASGGPADKAGLQGGDILLTVEGQPVNRIRDLARVLEPMAPGMELRLVLRRGDHEHSVSLVLGKEAREPAGLSGPPAKPSPVLFGLIFSGNQSDIHSVVAGSPAAKAGLRTGDRIQAVGAQAVSTRREVASALEAAVDDKVALLVQRGSRGRYLVLDAKAGLDVTPRFGMNNEAAGSEAM